MDTPVDPREILRIVLFRKWAFIIPLTLALVGAVGANFLLPELYRSEATILVQSEDVPENVVPSLVSEQIDRRLQVITQQVLVTGNLARIADRYELYADERDELSRAGIANRMRARIETEPVVTPFNDARTGRSGQMTLAFRVAFSDPDPRTARDVANALADAYLATNTESRRDVVERTTDFLASERSQLDRRITAIEDELAAFKTTHRELLPEEATFKREVVGNLEQRLRSLESDLRILRERESYLATQLALTEEFETAGGRGETPESRLEVLRAELASAEARYRPSHPDVVRLQREVRSLEGVVGRRSGASSLAERESVLVGELATLRERYTDEHPDVRRVRRELAAVRADLEASGGRNFTTGVDRNPTFVQLSSQLNSVRTEIAAVEEQRAELRDERENLQAQLARAPEIEREYERIVRRLESAVNDREELADKETTARLSGALEATTTGGQLTLVQPATFPQSPHSPPTKLILALGLVLGGGSGGVALVLRELTDRSIRSANDLARILGDSPLVAIPAIETPSDRFLRRLRRFGLVGLVLLLLAGGLTWTNYRIAPLDVLAYQGMRITESWIANVFPSE